MAIYGLKCPECETEIEKICSYEVALQSACPVCGSFMKLQPSRAAFKVNGYCFENGYHREEISYDGSTPDPW